MRKQHNFRPTALSLSTLEERINLSHAGAAAAVMRDVSASAAVVRGTIATTLPSAIVGGYTAKMAGSAADTKFGPIKVSIQLSSNSSLASQYSGTQGTMTERSASRHKPGVMTIELDGPASNLQTGDLSLTFTVGSATGVFSAAAGGQGTAVLLITTKVSSHQGIATGKFTLIQMD